MTLGPGYFDEMYAAAADPWGLRSRWYETRKYAISLAMLPRQHYARRLRARLLDRACSPEMLAPRCDRLLACDGAAAAVRAAAAHTARFPNVRVEQRTLPRRLAGRAFDLIVLSEFLYYFAGARPGQVLDLAARRAASGRHPARRALAAPGRRYPRSGDDVHAVLAAAGLARLADHREPDFLAEVYIRAEGSRSRWRRPAA